MNIWIKKYFTLKNENYPNMASAHEIPFGYQSESMSEIFRLEKCSVDF